MQRLIDATESRMTHTFVLDTTQQRPRPHGPREGDLVFGDDGQLVVFRELNWGGLFAEVIMADRIVLAEEKKHHE